MEQSSWSDVTPLIWATIANPCNLSPVSIVDCKALAVLWFTGKVSADWIFRDRQVNLSAGTGKKEVCISCHPLFLDEVWNTVCLLLNTVLLRKFKSMQVLTAC